MAARYMYDSVNPNHIPPSATMVAGYVDGRFANIPTMRHLFPHAIVVEIAVRATTNDGHVLDVERGDATPEEAVNWVLMRRHSGADPTIYCSHASWSKVRSVFQTHDLKEPHYWIADWNDTNTIPSGAVAHQYKNTPGYDISAVVAYWPGVDKTPVKIPVSTKPTTARYIVKKGDTLSAIAEKYHTTVSALVKLNSIADPNLIFPGESLLISGTVTHIATYIVRSGDTLTDIAKSHGLTLSALLKANPQIHNANLIHPGDVVYL